MLSPDAPVGPDEDGHLCSQVSTPRCFGLENIRFDARGCELRLCVLQVGPYVATTCVRIYVVCKQQSGACAQISVPAAPAFHLLYHTGFQRPVLHHRPALGHHLHGQVSPAAFLQSCLSHVQTLPPA